MKKRILRVHSYYRHRAGEDMMADADRELAVSAGFEVIDFTRSNADFDRAGAVGKARIAGRTIWNQSVYRELRELIRQQKPDLAHFTNTFPIISPSAYHACAAEGVPVVQSIHNFRLLCANAKFLREGSVCELCLEGSPWHAARYACYEDSVARSALVAAMLSFHRALKTYSVKIDTYVTLLEFSRQKLIEGGVPAEKIVIKPNFLPSDPGLRQGTGRDVLFIGRLSREKGIETLLQAWKSLGGNEVLRIGGTGPEMDSLQRKVQSDQIPNVEFLGQLERDRVLEEMKNCRLLVFPSEWYEGFPLTIVEAFACGTPVLASNLGAMSELIQDGRNGVLFESGSVESLGSRLQWCLNNGERLRQLGLAGRQDFESRYTVEKNREILRTIFLNVLERTTLE